jgi:hypothetical protein
MWARVLLPVRRGLRTLQLAMCEEKKTISPYCEPSTSQWPQTPGWWQWYSRKQVERWKEIFPESRLGVRNLPRTPSDPLLDKFHNQNLHGLSNYWEMVSPGLSSIIYSDLHRKVLGWRKVCSEPPLTRVMPHLTNCCGTVGGKQQSTAQRLTFDGCDTAVRTIWD